MESSRYFHLRQRRSGRGTSGNCSAAKTKAANAPHCRQARAVRHRGGTFKVRNHRLAVDLSGARPRHLKSEFLSTIKANLASSRFIFGLYAILGGIGAAIGAIWFLVDADDPRPYMVESLSVTFLVTAGLYPLIAYIFAIFYFVFLDAIKGLISLNRSGKAPNT